VDVDNKNGNVGSFEVRKMERGGILITDDEFMLQIGAYPESIKDTMKIKRGVPDLYLLPEELFDLELGVNAADIEFPAYYNFFIKGRKLRFICHSHQLRPIMRVLREAVFGPWKIDVEDDFINGRDSFGFPDFQKEMDFFRENPKSSNNRLLLKHIAQPYIFDENRQVVVDGVRITEVGYNHYFLQKGGKSCEAKFENVKSPTLPVSPDISSIPQDGFYNPPLFGITVISSGHGFDTGASTSGFIIWINRKGILVDPPVNSTEWLKHNQINTRLIEDLILTHCHADHDSGTLQKILEEGKIRVHTTETIMKSFITKYRSLTGLTEKEFRTLFSFDPVHIGQPAPIIGGRFHFKYSLHSIPTIGFNVNFQDKTFVYSSDTLFDPKTIHSLCEKGVISQDRMEDLLNFPWQGTVVFHEAGIPPIHTPIESLTRLPDEVKKNLYLVHVSRGSVPTGEGLKCAKTGVGNTIIIDVPKPETSFAHRMLDVMAHIDLFREMPVKKALEFLAVAKYSAHEPGEVIIKQGIKGDRFYMILSGEVEIIASHLSERLVYGRYDYIGETALILDQPRSADVAARTHLELLYMERHDFIHFLRDTHLKENFTRLANNRKRNARLLFERHPILETMSPRQKNQLMCIMQRKEIPRGACLYHVGEPVVSYFLIEKGDVMVCEGDRKFVVGVGALIGEFNRALQVTYHSSEAWAETDLSVYRIPAGELKVFFQMNPGIYLRLLKAMM